jgi:predicted RNA-binding Zn ribbon-like protein
VVRLTLVVTTPVTPRGIGLIEEFVNSANLEGETDAIATPDGLRDWLADHELLPARANVTDADVPRAQEVRESIRSLLQSNSGAPLDQSALASLNASAEDAHLRVRFDAGGGAQLVPDESGVPGALAQILALTYTAMADDTWSRLKVCREHTCQWAFYDHSKNRSRTWCSMSVCGNRTKARTYRSRRRG